MTQPGWYPDPWHDGNSPAPQRYWDGSTWTGHLQGGDGGGGNRRRPLTAIIVGAAVLVAGGIVAAFLLLGGDDGDDKEPVAKPDKSSPAPESSEPETDDGGGDGDPDADEETGGFVEDEVNGLRIPTPADWEGEANDYGAFISTGSYPCPSIPETNCVRGGLSSFAASEGYTAKNAEGIARQDITANAEASYGANQDGTEAYGGISTHKELAAEAVTVAGEKGYLIRWRVVTAKGDDGIVQSVVFPSPHEPGTFLVLRYGIDDNDDAPSVDEMKTLIEGIEPGDSASSGGGSGTEA